jgi:hypothetical protein
MQQFPDIVLSGKVHAYLRHKQASCLTLELKPLMSCCVPYSPPPHITLTAPGIPSRFYTIHKDNITIYLDRSLSDIQRLSIDKRGFSIFSWLSVTNWQPLPL